MSRRTATEVRVFMDACPQRLSRLRTVVGCLAGLLGMTQEETDDTKMALTEACANAIRHGIPEGQPGTVAVKLVAGPSGILAEVTDHGEGFDIDTLTIPEAGSRPGGLGIPLMRALTDRVEFLRNEQGMTVRLFKEVNGRRGRPPFPRA